MSAFTASAQLPCGADGRPSTATVKFLISAGTITLPVGSFLLIRNQTGIGAIRLISIDPKATEFYGKSTYESYFQPNKFGNLAGKDAVHLSKELNILPPKGPGRGIYIFRPKGYVAIVGNWKFDFGTPTMMTMSDTSFWTGYGDHGFEFAPTSSCNISEIDITNSHLRWFRYDREAHLELSLSSRTK